MSRRPSARDDRRQRVAGAFELTCACAMWPPSLSRDARVQAAARGIVDWEHGARVIARHRVAGLAAAALRAAGVPVPPAIVASAAASTHGALRLASAGARIARAFAERGIALALVKGPPLALEAFGDLGLRHSKDIDLLVAPRDVTAAWAILDTLGYRRETPPPELPPALLRSYLARAKDSVLYGPGGWPQVEVHWRLNDVAGEEVHPHTAPLRSVRLGGVDCATLPPDVQFRYLCVHGASHGWMRLKWLADIGALVAAHPDVDELWDGARRTTAATAVESALRLSATLLRTPLPRALHGPPGRRVRALDRLALRTLTGGDGAAEPIALRCAGAREPLAQMLVTDRWRERAGVAGRVVMPVEDMLLLRLPTSVRGLYPLLRLPLWLWKKATGHGAHGAA